MSDRAARRSVAAFHEAGNRLMVLPDDHPLLAQINSALSHYSFAKDDATAVLSMVRAYPEASGLLDDLEREEA